MNRQYPTTHVETRGRLRMAKATLREAVAPGPFTCLYCGVACDLTDHEPYCSDDCAASAARESVGD